MKIYRCFIGVLLVFFIALAVLYITSVYDERRSIEEGILVSGQKECDARVLSEMKGEEAIVTGNHLC